MIQFLRGFKKPSGKQGEGSQEQIAQTIADFEGKTRQGVDDHERRFRESGGNLLAYLTRQRKVDAEVVEAVRSEIRQCPLRETGELAGLSAPSSSGMAVSKLAHVDRLLPPDGPMREVSVSLFWLVFLLRLFFHGVPLRVLAQWYHVHPTTVLRWIVGLALALWPQISQWIVTRVEAWQGVSR